MFDQLLSPCNPGANLIGLEIDKIQIITFLTLRKEIVEDLGQRPGNFVGFDKMEIEEATHPRMFSGREAVLEQQSRYRIKAGIVETVHTGGPTAGIGKHAGIFQGLACPLQTVSHDIVPCLHYNVTPSRCMFCQNGMAR